MKPDTPGCPFVGGREFDPQQIDQVINPHPWLAAARREAPVFYMPKHDQWCVTRYEDVLAVLKDTETFSSQRVIEPRMLPGFETLPFGHPVAKNLINTDPPEHIRLRKLAQRAFTPRMVASYEADTRDLAERLVDGFAQAGSTDLVQEFTRALVFEMMALTIGIPSEKVEDFRRYEQALLATLTSAPQLPPDEEHRVAQEVIAFGKWLVEFIEDRRRDPQDDFTSQLIQAEGDDGTPSLTTVEVLRVVHSTLTAGVDTTASAMATSVYLLLQDRSHWDAIQKDPSLIPTMVEECLRFEGPVRGVRRDVTRDTVVGEVAIPAGATLYVSYASAQRDDAVFTDPDVFDPERDDVSQHFAFGKWTHFCLGAALARMELKVALEVLSARLPTLRLAEDPGPDVIPTMLGCFLTSLRVVWDPETAIAVGPARPTPVHIER